MVNREIGQKIACVGGPSGAGKDTIVSAFLREHPDYARVPRCTTREPRPFEIPGFDYFFLSKEEFSEREAEGLICGVDLYCGERYGIDLKSIYGALQEGKNVIGVFGICAVSLRKVFLKIQLVYITAPLKVLEQRLRYRGHPEVEIRQRLAAAVHQWDRGDPEYFDHIVKNTGTVDDAVQSFASILSSLALKV